MERLQTGKCPKSYEQLQNYGDIPKLPQRTRSTWVAHFLFGVLCALMALALRLSPRIWKIIVILTVCTVFFTVYRVGQSSSGTVQRQNRDTLSVHGDAPVRAEIACFFSTL